MSVWFWIVCWITSSIAIVGNATVIYGIIESNEKSLEVLNFLHSIFFTASVLNLYLMTVDRYIAIAFPYKYLAVMKRRRVAFQVPLLWIKGEQEEAEKANSVFYPSSFTV